MIGNAEGFESGSGDHRTARRSQFARSNGEGFTVGTAVAPAIVEVVNLVDKSAGAVVHLRLLPGEASNYVDALDR